MRNILIYFAIKYHGDYQKILNAIKTKEKVQNEDLQKLLYATFCYFLSR